MKPFRLATFALISIIAVGTTGYMLIEKWSILDALYMTVISITTTGYAEVKPLSEAGRLFTIVLIISGVGSIAYLGGRGVQALLEYQLFRRRLVRKKVGKLKDHYIVCGYGRLGDTICEELADMNVPFVAIEKQASLIDQLIETKMLFIEGDATLDDTLIAAGIEKAKGLIAVLATDADNVYVTLSAKVLNPAIFVVSRAIEEETEQKLMHAGADRVVKPYDIGATRMVHLLTRPAVVDFIDLVNKKEHDLSMEEIVVSQGSPLDGQTLANAPIREELNVIIIAIYQRNGTFLYNPRSDSKISEGDRLMAIGQSDGLAKLNHLCRG